MPLISRRCDITCWHSPRMWYRKAGRSSAFSASETKSRQSTPSHFHTAESMQAVSYVWTVFVCVYIIFQSSRYKEFSRRHSLPILQTRRDIQSNRKKTNLKQKQTRNKKDKERANTNMSSYGDSLISPVASRGNGNPGNRPAHSLRADALAGATAPRPVAHDKSYSTIQIVGAVGFFLVLLMFILWFVCKANGGCRTPPGQRPSPFD